jgi:hypothetical protein
MPFHLSVCVSEGEKRTGFVITAATESAAVEIAEQVTGRIGYCGNHSLSEALTRAEMMERDAPWAWGPCARWGTPPIPPAYHRSLSCTR